MIGLDRRAFLVGLLLAPLAFPAEAAASGAAPKARTPWLLFPLWTEYRGVSSRFGSRRMNRKREFHSGVDLRAPEGTPVHAAREGVILTIGRSARAGNYIKLQHLGQWTTVYCHLPDAVADGPLREGDRVAAWQPISRVGMSGRTSGPHLHMGLRNPDGGWEDPLLHLHTPTETLHILRSAR